MGQDTSVVIKTGYGMDPSRSQSGDQIPVWANFFVLVQTGPGAHPAYYAMGTRYFPVAKRPVRDVNHSPSSSAARLKEEYSYTPTPPLCTCGMFQGELYVFTVYTAIVSQKERL